MKGYLEVNGIEKVSVGSELGSKGGFGGWECLSGELRVEEEEEEELKEV